MFYIPITIRYNIYFFGFVAMETSNWLIVLIQFGLTNVFLHHRFSSYGFDVRHYARQNLSH